MRHDFQHLESQVAWKVEWQTLTFCASQKGTQRREGTVYGTHLSKVHEFNSCAGHLNRHLLNSSLLLKISLCLGHCLFLKLLVSCKSSWQKEFSLREGWKEQKQRLELAQSGRGTGLSLSTHTYMGTGNQSMDSWPRDSNPVCRGRSWSISSLPSLLFSNYAGYPRLCLSNLIPTFLPSQVLCVWMVLGVTESSTLCVFSGLAAACDQCWQRLLSTISLSLRLEIMPSHPEAEPARHFS